MCAILVTRTITSFILQSIISIIVSAIVFAISDNHREQKEISIDHRANGRNRIPFRVNVMHRSKRWKYIEIIICLVRLQSGASCKIWNSKQTNRDIGSVSVTATRCSPRNSRCPFTRESSLTAYANYTDLADPSFIVADKYSVVKRGGRKEGGRKDGGTLSLVPFAS